jgi:glycosyltransferase involved in cell wall biosynthesis
MMQFENLPNKVRILYVIDSMTRDGAETQLLKTLSRLPSSEFEAFIVLSREAGERFDQLVTLPIVQNVTILNDGRRASVSSMLENVFKLGGVVKATEPDLIHSWLWYSNFLCGLASRFSLSSHLPLIVSQRGDYQARYGRFRLWLTEKVIYNRADVILTNAAGIRDNLCSRYPEKQIVWIKNIIDIPPLPTPRQEGVEGEVPHIVSVGRLAAEKGHQFLIEALHLLNTKFDFPDFRATIFGEGELNNELRRLIDNYQLSDRVQLPGFCDDVFSALSCANLFVLPSLHESSPNALIEAMGVGVPCIASAVGGILDLIDDGESGLLIPPAASDALAETIHRVLTNRELAENLGKRARRKIQDMFDNDQSIGQLETVYRECYAAKR